MSATAQKGAGGPRSPALSAEAVLLGLEGQGGPNNWASACLAPRPGEAPGRWELRDEAGKCLLG